MRKRSRSESPAARIEQSRLDEIDANVLAEMEEHGDDGGGSQFNHDEPEPEAQMVSKMQRKALDMSVMMRAPKYDEEKIADYEPRPYEGMDWNKVDAEDRLIEGIDKYWDTCQLCDLDQTDQEKEGWPALENLRSCGDRHYHNMTPIALAKMMLKMYDTTVRPGVEGDIPMRTRMFWLHIDVHAPTIKHMTEDDLRTMNNASRLLRDGGMFEEHTITKQMKLAAGPSSTFLRLIKEKKPYMKAVTEMRAARGIA